MEKQTKNWVKIRNANRFRTAKRLQPLEGNTFRGIGQLPGDEPGYSHVILRMIRGQTKLSQPEITEIRAALVEKFDHFKWAQGLASLWIHQYPEDATNYNLLDHFHVVIYTYKCCKSVNLLIDFAKEHGLLIVWKQCIDPARLLEYLRQGGGRIRLIQYGVCPPVRYVTSPAVPNDNILCEEDEDLEIQAEIPSVSAETSGSSRSQGSNSIQQVRRNNNPESTVEKWLLRFRVKDENELMTMLLANNFLV